jgi:hypothetical protein
MPLPSKWIEELKKIGNVTNNTKVNTSTTKSPDFVNTLLSIQKKNPEALDKLIKKLRENYK